MMIPIYRKRKQCTEKRSKIGILSEFLPLFMEVLLHFKVSRKQEFLGSNSDLSLE